MLGGNELPMLYAYKQNKKKIVQCELEGYTYQEPVLHGMSSV